MLFRFYNAVKLDLFAQPHEHRILHRSVFRIVDGFFQNDKVAYTVDCTVDYPVMCSL